MHSEIERAVAGKVAASIRASGNAFCRVTFAICSRTPRPEQMTETTKDTGGCGTALATDEQALDVLFEIFKQQVPKTSARFLSLAQSGQYDGCPVHRVVAGGWIQCGDIVDGSGANSGTSTVLGEPETFAVKHDAPGVLGACHAASGEGGSQFYVTLKPLQPFDGKFVAFGRSVMGSASLLDLLQRNRGLCDENTQRPIRDTFVVKKMVVFC
ncbi:peptidylprolyl isomerase domain-containing protein [Besnoitia besnoiti]|uniref:Peptidyl-prolyl cis-trans isomerase n=1 Tax=Besnoitia besnoiti TaxID=94643 RepID=A0A2A9M911_BESBE|nr:peptidylprolyl isomerase domain-containing protein [Besnoitia besnoiti]PFH34475.1 peptidylprolyl isomerase domain-containing protein [Besnoitia besnoiti]